MRRPLFALLLLAALAAGAASASAEKRLALVIGNDAYQQVPPLSKAATDANAIASALRKLDFTVTVAENQSRATLSQSLLSFGTTIGPGDTVFFFFAGHGFEIRGRNYLLPTDVPAATEGQEDLVRDASFEVERIIDRLQERGARTMIVVLDACRNNPFARPGTRAVGGEGGLAPITPPEGTFILFSAGAKQTALDSMSQSDPDPNSVFTRNFVRELAQPKLTLVQLAKRTQAQVRGLASSIKHEQTPAYYDEIVGDFILNTREGTASEPQIAALNVPRPEPGPAASAKGGGEERTAAAFNVPRPEAIAPRPEPPPAPAQPINAPLATFMRSNSGWSVTMSFLDPVTAISWRLGEDGPFKETGALDALDPRTRRRMANPTFGLDPDQGATAINVRAIDLNGNVAGPFPIKFDPDAELGRGERRTLEMIGSDWVSFREYNGLLLYYTALVSSRCGIREARIGIDNTRPDTIVPMPPCDPLHPAEIPSKAKVYMQLPPKTQMVTIELTYRDGSVSETKTFKKTSHMIQ
jgi:hypothetical protein